MRKKEKKNILLYFNSTLFCRKEERKKMYKDNFSSVQGIRSRKEERRKKNEYTRYFIRDDDFIVIYQGVCSCIGEFCVFSNI